MPMTYHLKLVAAAAATALSFGLAQAAPTVVNFEADTAGPKANGFVSGGVTFSDSMGAGLSVLVGQSPECNSTCLAVLSDDTSALIMSFGQLTGSLSLEFGNDQPGFFPAGGLAYLQLYLGNVLVGEASTVVNEDDIMNQTVSYVGAAFDNAVFAYTDAAKNRIDLIEVVDNITYEAAAQVPEPGTLALAGLALAGLGYSRRRKA